MCCQGFILAGGEEAGWLPDVLGCKSIGQGSAPGVGGDCRKSVETSCVLSGFDSDRCGGGCVNVRLCGIMHTCLSLWLYRIRSRKSSNSS